MSGAQATAAVPKVCVYRAYWDTMCQISRISITWLTIATTLDYLEIGIHWILIDCFCLALGSPWRCPHLAHTTTGSRTLTFRICQFNLSVIYGITASHIVIRIPSSTESQGPRLLMMSHHELSQWWWWCNARITRDRQVVSELNVSNRRGIKTNRATRQQGWRGQSLWPYDRDEDKLYGGKEDED